MSTTRQYISSILRYASAHKLISAIVIIVAVGAGWWGYGKLTSTSGQTSYVLGTVSTGTIVASLSESGQVSTTNSIDLKPQVSGTITWVGVKPGDTVHAGEALATIDDTDAQQSYAAAKRQLDADELSYQQSQAQAPINYQNDLTALTTAQTNLADDYNTVYNDLSNTYLDLPAVMTGAQNTLYGYTFDSTKQVWNMDYLLDLFSSSQDTSSALTFKSKAIADYNAAYTAYNADVAAYKLLERTSATSTIEDFLAQSTTMTTAVAQAAQSELNFLGSISDLAQSYNVTLPTAFATLQSGLRSNLSTANGDLSTLLSDKKTLDNAKQSITSAQQAIVLDQVGNPAGDNPISLQVAANNIEKEKEALATQAQDLAYYTITAPYAGVISAVDVQKGDQAGSAAVATLVSTQQIAELSINEVDAAKLKLGQKATLTFDAIPDLTLTGTVTQLSPVGTVSQGVVSYDVQITFDAQSSQVKPGMTVNADIQTGSAVDVLVVPQAAVKAQGAQSYVLAFTPPIPQAEVDAAGSAGVVTTQTPVQVPVETGLSDDTNIEITSGLSAGQQIVVGTRTGTTASSASATRTAASAGTTGGNATFRAGGGGGAVIRGL